MMNKYKSVFGLFVFGTILLIIEPMNLPGSLFAEAEAVVGRPITPVSYAGVARRTTRRTVYAATTVYAPPPVYVAPAPTTVVVQDNSYAEQQTAQAQQQATLPVGATLPGLPNGCASMMIENQSFFSCGANWFRPAMQNGNIVYAVVPDPR